MLDEIRIEKILRLVESIPVGYVATYGDIGQLAGESPRLVGRVLAQWGSTVPWWRVCNAKGQIPGHLAEALPYWIAEQTPLVEQTQSADQSVLLKEARVALGYLDKLSQQGLTELNYLAKRRPQTTQRNMKE